jgi:Cdc25 family phosphatase
MFGAMPKVEYLSRAELAEIIKLGKECISIIDVRDEDFVGGHIKGAINSPSEDLEDDDELEALVGKVCLGKRRNKCSKVVFHCMKSQERGPTCARRFANKLSLLMDEETEENSDNKLPTIFVLQGGFEEFAAAYSNDIALCDDINTTKWK